jgi:hypothetical protein
MKIKIILKVKVKVKVKKKLLVLKIISKILKTIIYDFSSQVRSAPLRST